MGHSQSGKVGSMRHSAHTLLILIVCLVAQARLSEVVEGSGDEEEFDQDAAINEAVNKVTELVTSWADNLEDLDLDLEINQEENEITDEKAAKQKRKCAKCQRKSFRGRNTEFCEGCQGEQEQQETEVTTALTTPQSSNHNHNHRLIYRRRKLEERCQKCSKNTFRARNENFCSTKCAQEEADMEEVKTTTSTTSSTTTTTTTTSTTTQMMTTTTEMTKCLSRCSR